MESKLDRSPAGAESALMWREPQMVAAMLESFGDAVVLVDPAWRVSYWNAAAERLTGVHRTEVLGVRLWDRFATLADTRLAVVCREAMERRQPGEMRGWEFGGPGDGRGAGRFDVRCFPVERHGVAILFASAAGRLQEEQELAERAAGHEELRSLARQMAAVPDSATLLRVMCDAARQQCRADGATVTRIVGADLVIVSSAGSMAPHAGRRFPLAGSLTARVLDTRLPVAGDATTDATPMHDELGIGPILLAPLISQDQVIGVLAVTRPASAAPFTPRDAERLAVLADHAAVALWKSDLLEQAQAANEAKANFLATMSHELRTPLTALTGYSELLVDQVIGPLSRQQLDVVERMRTVTHHLSVMIEEVLTYSAIEAGRARSAPREVCIDELLRATAAVIEPLAATKGLRLDCEIPEPAPRITTDPDKVRQILVNLASNAVKFTERGEVAMWCSAHGDEIRFAVRDTGIGITPDGIARLFQPFSQLDAGLTRKHGGTGLGLYISRRLASVLGGRLEVESCAGSGSTFTLILPASAASPG